MPVWIKAIISFLRGAGAGREDKLWKEADDLREAYRDLMADYQKLSQDMRLELTAQLDELRNEIETLRAALEREKTEHQECRRRLSRNEDEISTLKGQVKVLMERTQSDAGS